MRTRLLLAMAMVLASWPGLPVLAQQHALLSLQERNFIAEALGDSMAERSLGKLAQDRAETPAVRAFARRMADGHEMLEDRLVGMAQRHGIPLPRELNASARAHMASLRDLPEGAFDRRYMAATEETHARSIKLYEAQAERSGETADLARATLPMLHAHFEEARTTLAELARNRAEPPPGAGSSQ